MTGKAGRAERRRLWAFLFLLCLCSSAKSKDPHLKEEGLHKQNYWPTPEDTGSTGPTALQKELQNNFSRNNFKNTDNQFSEDNNTAKVLEITKNNNSWPTEKRPETSRVVIVPADTNLLGLSRSDINLNVDNSLEHSPNTVEVRSKLFYPSFTNLLNRYLSLKGSRLKNKGNSRTGDSESEPNALAVGPLTEKLKNLPVRGSEWSTGTRPTSYNSWYMKQITDRPTINNGRLSIDSDKSTFDTGVLVTDTGYYRNLERTKRRVTSNYQRNGRSENEGVNNKEGDHLDKDAKGRKGAGGAPNIDDIIHGIMKLLGGNVKITATDSQDTRLTTFSPNTRVPISTRINNRGPPRLPLMPFGILPPPGVPGLTRPPIRPPITPPGAGEPDNPNKPQFVANTRPPYLVPLPPALSARPTLAKPFLTGIPIPEDVLSSISPKPDKEATAEEGESTVSPSFVDVSEEPETTTEAAVEVTEESVDTLIHSSLPPSTTKSAATSTSTATPPLEDSEVFISASPAQTPNLQSTTSVKKINLISSKTTAPPVVKPSRTKTSPPFTRKSTVSPHPSPHPNDVPISSGVKKDSHAKPYTPPLSKPPPQIIEGSMTDSPVTKQPTIPTNTNFGPSSTRQQYIPSRLPGPIRPYRPTQFATTGHPGLVLTDSVEAESSTLPSSSYIGSVITARPIQPFNYQPDIFDVTVSALQGYGAPVRQTYRFPGNVDPLITSAKRPGDGSVYIDGRKTYFDLNPATGVGGNPIPVQTMGVGTVIPEKVSPPTPQAPVYNTGGFNPPARPPPRQPPPRQPTPGTQAPPPRRVPTLGPPKRIDTCIVGYDTTCKEELGEVCRTEGDVSSCFCRPGTARKRSRTKCKKSVLLHLSIKVDRIGQRRIVWGGNYANPEAKEYQLLQYEAEKALDSALGESRAMSGLYMESSVNKFYSLGGRVIVNSTVKLLDTPQTSSPNIRRNLQRHLIKVIQTNNNYIGNSVLAVEGPLNPIPDVSDVNECFDASLYDCHNDATCSNTFGSYACVCNKGFTDRYPDNDAKSGRFCDSCSRDYCSKRGECRIEDGVNVCRCENSFYGTRCEIDGEVIAVAVGASVAAVVIIVLTLIFLCMWSQRWKAQDRKTEILSRFPGGGLFGGWMAGRNGFGAGRQDFSVDVPQKGANTYGVTMEDRMRWAQIAESLVQQNVYATSGSAGTNSSTAALQQRLRSIYGKRRPSKRGLVNDVLRLFTKRGRSNPLGDGLPSLSPQEALVLHQMIALQAQQGTLHNQPEQMRSTQFYHDQRKVMPPASDYASVGTLNGFPQHFGMQHLNPNLMAQNYGTKASSTYGQYGPSSFNAPSVGGVSRAPTMGARTPLPVRDLLGGTTSMGPFGGGVAAKKNLDGVGALLTESSEEDPDRPYQLPRPKSRASALDNDDMYFEPDDMMTPRLPPPLPTTGPPPIPHYQFDQFFKSKFP